MSYLWNKSHPMEFTKSVIVLFYYCFWGICALLATYWSFWSFFVKGAIFYIGTTMIASHFGPELSMYLLDHDKSPLPLKGKCSVRCWLHIVRWLNWLLFSMESSGVYKQAVPVLLPLAQIGLTGDWARPGPKMPFSCCSYKMSINVLYSVLIVDIRITVKLSYIYPILNTRSLLLSSMITK